ncbi:hypothetical protein HK101_002971 [Irineochytrium annulatum]|nr:hypothetical protein HK101_002971 [Irineochytrium annulatum]
MNSLVGYGSDSDSGADDGPAAGPLPSGRGPSGSGLSAPKDPQSDAALGKRKRVQIMVDLPAPHSVGAGDDDASAAAAASSSKRSGLFAFLPPPKSSAMALPPPKGSTATGAAAGLTAPLLVPTVMGRKRPLAEKPVGPARPKAPAVEAEDPPVFDDQPFFTLDTATIVPELPKASSSSFRLPTVDLAADAPEPLPSSSSSYIYNPEQSMEAYAAMYDGSAVTPIGAEEEERAEDVIKSNDMHVSRMTKRGKKEQPMQLVEISQREQLGDTWKTEAQKNLTMDRPSLDSIQHMKPDYHSKKHHNIMALAYDAKVREYEFQEAVANRRLAKKASQQKYGW